MIWYKINTGQACFAHCLGKLFQDWLRPGLEIWSKNYFSFGRHAPDLTLQFGKTNCCSTFDGGSRIPF